MWLNLDILSEASVGGLQNAFRSATPFPHVVVDNMLNGSKTELIEAFPEPQWPEWQRYADRYQHGKMKCSDIARIPPVLAALIEEFTRPQFLEFLQSLTGIPKLLVDPYLEGGGLHCSGPGGVLVPHTDFHLYPRLGIYRRINVLLYLNEKWETSWGGCLEFFAPGSDTPAREIVPTWGKCVIFETDDRSRHGFSQPVLDGHWRRSVALYYYTAKEAPTYSGDTNTYWDKVNVLGKSSRLRQWAYQAIIFGSRSLAFVAHRIDPSLPRRTRPK